MPYPTTGYETLKTLLRIRRLWFPCGPSTDCEFHYKIILDRFHDLVVVKEDRQSNGQTDSVTFTFITMEEIENLLSHLSYYSKDRDKN